jgi:tRNA-modifying protein YgfZ
MQSVAPGEGQEGLPIRAAVGFNERPDQAVLDEYAALTSGAGLVALPLRSQIEITGQDRATFLHGFCTADIKKLQPGQGTEAFITNHQGKAAGHGLIFCEAERLVFDGAAGQAEKLIAHFDRFVIGERIEFRDRTADWFDLLVVGPKAEYVKIPANRCEHFEGIIGGIPVRMHRVDWLPVPSFLVRCAADSRENIFAAHAAGAREVSDPAWEMARVEAGYPLYGRDITEDNLPQEVQRNEQAISFTKGCYLGQETIARLDALGHVNRVLTGLKFLGEKILQPGETIMQAEKKLAQITSVAWSPRLQAPLALAYVRTLYATPGKRLAFKGGEAEVVKLPLH